MSKEPLTTHGNFKSATELCLSEMQYCGLVKTLALLDSGVLDHENEYTAGFDMSEWGIPEFSRQQKGECGTICCIGGTAETVMGKGRIFERVRFHNPNLRALFYPGEGPASKPEDAAGWKASTAQAAEALRGYLETGKSDWAAAMKTDE